MFLETKESKQGHRPWWATTLSQQRFLYFFSFSILSHSWRTILFRALLDTSWKCCFHKSALRSMAPGPRIQRLFVSLSLSLSRLKQNLLRYITLVSRFLSFLSHCSFNLFLSLSFALFSSRIHLECFKKSSSLRLSRIGKRKRGGNVKPRRCGKEFQIKKKYKNLEIQKERER